MNKFTNWLSNKWNLIGIYALCSLLMGIVLFDVLIFTALIIIYGGAYANKQFKNIEWRASQKERGNDIVSYLKEMQSKFNLKQCRYARFIWGYCKIYNTGLYNDKRMMEQLDKCSQFMTRQANSGDYAKNIEDVYNYKKSNKNRVKFL